VAALEVNNPLAVLKEIFTMANDKTPAASAPAAPKKADAASAIADLLAATEGVTIIGWASADHEKRYLAARAALKSAS
jgi:hypothetical protein